MKSSFDSCLMIFLIYGLLFGENIHIFSKVHFILKKTWFILKFCEYVLINELYKKKKK